MREFASSTEMMERSFLGPDPGAQGFPIPEETIRRRYGIGTVWRASGRALDALRHQFQDCIDVERANGTGFLMWVTLVGCGCLAYFLMPVEVDLIVPLGALVILLASWWLVREKRWSALVVSAAMAILTGLTAASFQSWRLSTPMIGSTISTTLTGRIVTVEEQASERYRLVLDVVGTERPALRYAPQRIRVTARAVPDDLQLGETLRGYVRLIEAPGPVRPNGYDFGFRSYFDGLGATGFFMGNPIRVPAPPVMDESQWADIGTTIARSLERLRMSIAERIRAHVADTEGEIAVALIVGYRAGIPEALNEAMRRSGLAHVLSISGLHMALVAGTVMLLVRSLCAMFPVFSAAWPVKKLGAGAALAFCTLYLLLSGGDVAALRSYLMLAIMLCALLLDRAALSMRNVALAALIILLWTPHEIMGPSFQMSFGATAALVAGYGAWARRPAAMRSAAPSTWRRKVMTVLIGMIMTSVLAGLATTIFGIWHFQRASPYSLPANLFSTPAVSLLIMPGAVGAMLFMPFGLEGPFLTVMAFGIRMMLNIAQWFSDRSPIDGVGLMSKPAFFLLTLALVVLVVLMSRLRILAVPLVLGGAVLLFQHELPHAFILENGALVGLRSSDEALIVDKRRGSAFALQDWQRALKTDIIRRPNNVADGKGLSPEPDGPFLCDKKVCVARHSSGALVVSVDTAAEAADFCEQATLIVSRDAVGANPCNALASATYISARELALRGSLSVSFVPGGNALSARIEGAIDGVSRPWHAYRAFSRAARGMAPWQP